MYFFMMCVLCVVCFVVIAITFKRTRSQFRYIKLSTQFIDRIGNWRATDALYFQANLHWANDVCSLIVVHTMCVCVCCTTFAGAEFKFKLAPCTFIICFRISSNEVQFTRKCAVVSPKEALTMRKKEKLDELC